MMTDETCQAENNLNQSVNGHAAPLGSIHQLTASQAHGYGDDLTAKLRAQSQYEAGNVTAASVSPVAHLMQQAQYERQRAAQARHASARLQAEAQRAEDCAATFEAAAKKLGA